MEVASANQRDEQDFYSGRYHLITNIIVIFLLTWSNPFKLIQIILKYNETENLKSDKIEEKIVRLIYIIYTTNISSILFKISIFTDFGRTSRHTIF